MKVDFVRESAAAGDTPGVTSQRLVNCYPAPTSTGARAPFVLRSTLGYTSAVAKLNRTVRAAIGGPDFLYVAAGGVVYSISSAYISSTIGGVSDDADTILSRTEDGICASAGGNYYVWNGANLTQPGDGAFSEVGSVSFLDQYTVLSEKSGRRVEWTELADPTTRDALNVKTKEGRADDVSRVLATSGVLAVLGQESTETWYNTGGAGALAFERVQGAVLDVGLKSAKLCVEFENNVFFVGDDNTVYRMGGGTPIPISTSAVSYSLASETPTNVFAYEDRSHKFICVRFAGRPAWCYDLTTGAWHERSTGSEFGAWEVVEIVKAFGKWIAFTGAGSGYELSRVNIDGVTPMRRTMVSLPLDPESGFVSVSALEFRVQGGLADVKTGVFPGEDSREASAVLRISRDGGGTFGPEKIAKFGKIGEFGRRARFRGLGRSRHFTAELTISDPNELPVESSALLEAS